MKLTNIFLTALYRELRSSIGYYDARSIIRVIKENSNIFQSIEDFENILAKLGFDNKHIKITLDISRKNILLNN
jgi:hypothetical protein